MLRHTKNLALVLPHQLFKRNRVTLLCSFNERYVGVYLFRGWGLDGWHKGKGAVCLV